MRLPPHDAGTRLVLIRHLEPDDSVRGRMYGSLDVPLSPTARDQADQLARALDEVQFAAVYTSPLRRALETATPIAARRALTPQSHDGLRELDLGELEGLRYDELETQRAAGVESWMSDPASLTFPGGESFSDFRRRALSAADEIRARHPRSCVAVVAHGGVTRVIIAASLEMPDRALFRLDQPYGAVSVIDWLEATPVVRLMNANLLTPAGG